MAINIDYLSKLRPFLFHLTAAANVKRIREEGVLQPAAHLMSRAADRTFLRTRRPDHVSINVAGEQVSLRDQRPLHAGHLALEPGWSFEDLVAALNSRVYFWPGTAKGPNKVGESHWNRYLREENPPPVMLKIRTPEFLAANPERLPELCRYNSGSPRSYQGRKSPRGPRTFLPPAEADFLPSEVVEVTFPGEVRLPLAEVQCCDLAHWGNWRLL